MFENISTCPLCNSTNFKFFSKVQKNLYSEILSKILMINEDELIKSIYNLLCNNCGLVFKNKWFDNKYLLKIYNKYIPTHPRGKDFKSNLFSKKSFKKEYTLLLRAKKSKKKDLFKKHARRIKSIIFSIPNYKKLNATNWICTNSRSFDSTINLTLLKKYFFEITSLINKPSEFMRFSGFESPTLWKYILFNLKVSSYGEIGCPQWGLLELAKKSKKKIFYIKNEEKNFWGKRCKLNGKSCVIFKKNIVNFDIIDLDIYPLKKRKKIDLIGIYQYLDHLRYPLKFFEKLNKISKHQIFIVDKFKIFDNSIYIQHFTGWNKKSFNWISNRFQKKLLCNFKYKKNFENEIFLIK